MSQLGLPLEYRKHPEYFDGANIGDNSDKKNSLIEMILKKHQVKTVLDMTCGTGSQVFFLAKRGYKITGADFSPGLLKIARKKAKIENLDLKFIDGDMRTLKVGHFDAVITIFNAIGHLTEIGFEKAIRNIHKNLNQGGMYVFDILNLGALTDAVVSDFAFCREKKKVGDSQIISIQCSTLNRKNNRLTSYESYLMQKKADKPKKIDRKFSLQLYTAQQLRKILTRNGFEIVDYYDLDGSKFIENKTIEMLTVARKR